jgi:DNA-directed RNA polymerase subunit RPC12/RpoP
VPCPLLGAMFQHVNLMQVVNQYLCSTCGSVLKETAEFIEIHLLREEEECPSCGSMLAESLTRRSIRPQVNISPTIIQTADSLLPRKLKFDIPKIDSFLGLSVADLCCISGYGANLLLTRLCVRSLLPERYGGLNSPYVMVADTGNRTDVYGAVNVARQYGMRKENVAERIFVIRAFTVHQVRQLLSVELPNIVQKYQVRVVIIPGLLNAFDEDPNMRIKDVNKETSKIMGAVKELSAGMLVVTSVQQGGGRHSEQVLRTFKKRIHLVQKEKYGPLKAEIHNQGDSKVVNLTERELKIIPKK